jgi:hypothetical protein
MWTQRTISERARFSIATGSARNSPRVKTLKLELIERFNPTGETFTRR